MSTELFIQAFENGESQALRTQDVLSCFEGFIAERGDRWIKVRFSPADSSVLYFDVNEDTDRCIMVSCPCADL
ncbi:MAG: hypothetical protein AAGG51_14530 [Cyanobacteria bacterium P01_G01_bin.54]